MGDTPEYYFQQNARDQEANLVAWTLRQESLGYAPSQSQIRACVVAVLKQQGCDSRLGRHWVEKFIQRHPELRSKVEEVVESETETASVIEVNVSGPPQRTTRQGRVIKRPRTN
ncbi:Tc5 transposase DNA-binding domain-containing protein [Hirsutella rhossiliensis]